MRESTKGKEKERGRENEEGSRKTALERGENWLRKKGKSIGKGDMKMKVNGRNR